ncbi:MAG: hypothetical protein ACOYM3_32255 [Terrimicrobiaceae bacterium]
MADGRSVFILSASGNASDAKRTVEQTARKLQGVVLPASTGEGGAERVLVQIPSGNASAFESQALREFTEAQRGKPTGESRLYELILSKP